jgi:hypothetical protein
MPQLRSQETTCAAGAGSGCQQQQQLLPRRRAFMRAVSRCLDCSGLLMMTATWCTSSPCSQQTRSSGGRFPV